MTAATGMKADHLHIAADASATHRVRINHTGAPGAQSASFELITTGNGQAQFTLDPAAFPDGKIDFGMTAYELNPGDGSQLMPGANNWYLADTGLSNAADVILDTAATIPLDWNIALDSLHLRMGDLRAENLSRNALQNDTQKGPGNVWVRTRAYRLNATNSVTGRSFEQHGWGLTAGLDKRFQTEDAVKLHGAFIDMGGAARDFGRRGDNTSKNFGIGAYSTVLRDNGRYTDLVARAGRYTHDINALTTDGRRVDARSSNRVLGLSLEHGRRFRRADGWWVEPGLQASLLWQTGDSYDTSPEALRIHVRQDSLRSAQYRALVRFGRQAGGSNWHPYGKFAVVSVDTAGGALHAHGKDLAATYDGKRVEFGFGATYRINPWSQWYADYEYARSQNYERPWSLNLGYRRLW
jgi:outer membrane autotransporter protein